MTAGAARGGRPTVGDPDLRFELARPVVAVEVLPSEHVKLHPIHWILERHMVNDLRTSRSRRQNRLVAGTFSHGVPSRSWAPHAPCADGRHSARAARWQWVLVGGHC